MSVDRSRIARNDFATDLFRNVDAESGFAGAGRTDDGDDGGKAHEISVGDDDQIESISLDGH